MDIAFLTDTFLKLIAALPMTLILFVSSVAIGAVIATGLTAMRVSGNPVLAAISRAYVFVFRGSPLLIQMFLIYYGLGQFPAVRQSFAWPLLRDALFCAIMALAMCTAAYQAEVIRGGLQAVPAREIEAARACGMSGFLLLRRIIAPIALRQALPAYSTEIVLMVKTTSLASLVSVWEITGTAQKINAQTYRTMEIFLVAALIYLVINFVIIRLLGYVEYLLSPHLRGRPAPAST
ncbi:ABC transporter permease [Oryzibacter oryziterrae]|uniref:ABC transporter permease n=1 Tax=Oryzibacter oryziterrae TaxID=2766474 RepID=UPI001F1E7CE5|nr:ABC transporter permease [Oryzibacter oryziterrae]